MRARRQDRERSKDLAGCCPLAVTMDDTGNPSDFVKVTLSPDHPRTAGKSYCPQDRDWDIPGAGPGSEGGALSPSILRCPHSSPLPDHTYIKPFQLGWDVGLSSFAEETQDQDDGREEEGGTGTREWQVLGWRAVPRPYLEGTPDFQNPS